MGERFWPLGLFWAAVAIYAVHRQRRDNSRPGAEGRYRVLTVLVGTLPLAVPFGWLVQAFTIGGRAALEKVLLDCVPLFLSVSLYDMLLLALLPLLRRWIDARACALFWMLPNALYTLVAVGNMVDVDRVPWVIHVPARRVQQLVLLWGLGAAGVMLWSTLAHLHFKRLLLHPSRPVTDETVMAVWKSECAQAGVPEETFEKTYRGLLVQSPNTDTPLAIGLFRRRLVLPERQYTPEELALVLRHELIHIERGDIVTKFFLTFCTALCWWNPLMWLAMRCCADDLELSCDETVLLNTDETTRQHYAELVLTTAGRQQGYTTCLSASARALRYRLRKIVKPPRRFGGAAAAGILMMLLFLSLGSITLSWDAGTLEEQLLDGDAARWNVEVVSFFDSGGHENRYALTRDTEQLMQLLAGLRLEQVAGAASSGEEEEIVLILRREERLLGLNFGGGSVMVTRFQGSGHDPECYRLADSGGDAMARMKELFADWEKM